MSKYKLLSTRSVLLSISNFALKEFILGVVHLLLICKFSRAETRIPYLSATFIMSCVIGWGGGGGGGFKMEVKAGENLDFRQQVFGIGGFHHVMCLGSRFVTSRLWIIVLIAV